ncbi:hypothetical protein K457DRAFT_668708 [Linnemannia elongata AG-77]|uniref:Uncharacterized protein n=1 Tax=Linnemannia elongata AG-77 TaxID=1314771 RepID=A0A197JRT0_9FUNG|nr:hypothetical protein K457DRAFT_668708 [Linnemannia elongata AG-77]
MVAPTLAFLSQSLSLSTLDPSLMSLCTSPILMGNHATFPSVLQVQGSTFCLQQQPGFSLHLFSCYLFVVRPFVHPASHAISSISLFFHNHTDTHLTHSHPFTIICISL